MGGHLCRRCAAPDSKRPLHTSSSARSLQREGSPSVVQPGSLLPVHLRHRGFRRPAAPAASPRRRPPPRPHLGAPIPFLFFLTSALPSTMPVRGLENQSLNWACEAKTCGGRRLGWGEGQVCMSKQAKPRGLRWRGGGVGAGWHVCVAPGRAIPGLVRRGWGWGRPFLVGCAACSQASARRRAPSSAALKALSAAPRRRAPPLPPPARLQLPPGASPGA